jgi:ABC-type proline/glycine betaine transport system permease subunit
MKDFALFITIVLQASGIGLIAAIGTNVNIGMATGLAMVSILLALDRIHAAIASR